MDPVQITPKASQDIAKLAQGVNRAQVALEALTESALTPQQVQQLEALLEKVSPTDGAASATKLEAVAEVKTQVALEALTESALTPQQVKQLEAPLEKVSPTDGAASATKLEAVAEVKTVDGHQAVEGKITVYGQQLDTLLSEGSFGKTREDQIAYAAWLGYRIAAREENLAYVEGLLAKEHDGTINGPETKALDIYKRRAVRDTQGGLDVDGFVRALNRWFGYATPNYGALFVRASGESK